MAGTASEPSRPGWVHALLSPVPGVCFLGALVADLGYWKTEQVMWETFSDWLIAGGLLAAALAMITGFVDFVGRRTRSFGSAALRALGALLVFGLALLNAFVHSRDGYTAVVPEGLGLSAIVVFLLIILAWLDRPRAVRQPAAEAIP